MSKQIVQIFAFNLVNYEIIIRQKARFPARKKTKFPTGFDELSQIPVIVTSFTVCNFIPINILN